MPLGLSGSSAETEGIRRTCVPNPGRDLGMEMIMPEQHQVGLQGCEVDLDLVYVRVTGLHLPDAGMGNEQIGLVGAASFIGLFQSVERCLHAEHLRYGVDHDAPTWCTQLETLIGEAMCEVHLRERVR